MFKVGFVVGKFTPFHLGHKYLIDTAAKECDLVYVLPYSRPDLGVSDLDRWSAVYDHYVYKRKKVIVLFPDSDNIPDNDANPDVHRAFCAKSVFSYILGMRLAFDSDELRNTTPNVVYTSEDYGDGLAQFFSDVFNKQVTHVCVDKDRLKFPISGTQIRSGGYEEWIVKD